MLLVSREYSGVFTCYDVRRFEEIASSGVVSESLIVGKELIIVSSCKMLDSRVFAQDPLIKWYYSIRLGLLEEDLCEPYMIAICMIGMILSPWEVVSSVFSIPIEEYLPRE